jgi:molecular chaperone GrpE
MVARKHETAGARTPEPELCDSGGAPTPAAPPRVTSTEERPDAPVAPGEPEAPVAPPAPEPKPDQAPKPEDQPEKPAESADHEHQLERDLDGLAAKAEKADEYLDLAQRTKADFENYRKRASREAAAAQERGVAKLARELLPAVDNLDRALAAAQATSNGERTDMLVSGIKLVHAEVIAGLSRAGIERFSPEGEPFDPQLHEAVSQQTVEGAHPGTIVEVYQRGYRLGDAVIRPARVVVAG